MSYTIKEIAEQERVAIETVLMWVKRGDLQAYNVGRAPGLGKPRWRIAEASLEAFRQLRTPSPPTPKAKRKKRNADVIEFYK